MSIVASAWTEDDDDGSELTELRLGYEALFPVPESVSVAGSATGKSDGVESREKTEEMSTPSQIGQPPRIVDELARFHSKAMFVKSRQRPGRDQSS
jgi:hypothetical protein